MLKRTSCGVVDADLLTPDQVIDRLLEEPTVREAAATCILPAVRVGTEWRFRRSDLEDWIAKHTSRAARPAGTRPAPAC